MNNGIATLGHTQSCAHIKFVCAEVRNDENQSQRSILNAIGSHVA